MLIIVMGIVVVVAVWLILYDLRRQLECNARWMLRLENHLAEHERRITDWHCRLLSAGHRVEQIDRRKGR
jgi:hypothetical protein